jgi:hypothetical protein
LDPGSQTRQLAQNVPIADSPAIQQPFPAIALEEVYGAIAYYLGHRKLVEEYLQKQQRVWDDARNRNNASSGGVVH